MNESRALIPANTTSKRVRSALQAAFGSRIGRLLGRIGRAPKGPGGSGLLDLAGALLSLRGRASGPALASAFFESYEASPLADRQEFLAHLRAAHPRDGEGIDRAIARWQEKRDEPSAAALAEAVESPCQRLIRMLNLAPGGTARLIAMRADLLASPQLTPELRDFDRELQDVFETWFNAGFLELRRIDWASPAAVLERILAYEAVHSIEGWDDLRRRVQPADRRCYAFFHPQMHDDPLIFVEVALTNTLPSSIQQVISPDRLGLAPHEAACAIFYSISNCQQGLRGIPFGNFLIKQVVGVLKEDLPQLKRFATLSPVPGLAKWLAAQGGETPEGEALRTACARYIVQARDKRGGIADSVARFHLGNGARLEAIHLDADLSKKGLAQSHGVMVNYLYELAEIEENHVRLFELDTVATSQAVAGLLKASEQGKVRQAG